MTNLTTDGRAGLKISSRHPLIADLEALREKHGIGGCVLVCMADSDGRTSVTAAGSHAAMYRCMKWLGDRILARIDNGEDDPPDRVIMGSMK